MLGYIKSYYRWGDSYPHPTKINRQMASREIQSFGLELEDGCLPLVQEGYCPRCAEEFPPLFLCHLFPNPTLPRSIQFGLRKYL